MSHNRSLTNLSPSTMPLFKWFDYLPMDIIPLIILYLTLHDLYACTRVSKQFYTFFSLPLSKKLEEKILNHLFYEQKQELSQLLQLNNPYLKNEKFLQNFFFHCVVLGKQDEADMLLQQHPHIFPIKEEQAKGYSKRTFIKTNPFRYALWAKDTHMLHMFFHYLKRIGKMDYAKEQMALHEQHGLTYTIEENGILVTKNEFHFNFDDYINQLKKFITLLNNLGTSEDTLQNQWGKITEAQRLLPPHIAQRYCHPIANSFTHQNNYCIQNKFIRTLSLRHENEHWFLMDNFAGITRGINGVGDEDLIIGYNPDITDITQNRDALLEINATADDDLRLLKNSLDNPELLPAYEPYQPSWIDIAWKKTTDTANHLSKNCRLM